MMTKGAYIATLGDSPLADEIEALDSWEEGAFFSLMEAYELTADEALWHLNTCWFWHSYTLAMLADEVAEEDEDPQEYAELFVKNGYIETEYGVIRA